MSQSTIDQTEADKDQAAFDADVDYMCELVDRIPFQIDARRVTEAVAASLGRELDLSFSEFCLDGKILGTDGEPFWPTEDPAAELLEDWRYGPVTHGAYCPCGSRMEIRGELDADDYEALADFDYAHQDCAASQDADESVSVVL